MSARPHAERSGRSSRATRPTTAGETRPPPPGPYQSREEHRDDHDRHEDDDEAEIRRAYHVRDARADDRAEKDPPGPVDRGGDEHRGREPCYRQVRGPGNERHRDAQPRDEPADEYAAEAVALDASHELIDPAVGDVQPAGDARRDAVAEADRQRVRHERARAGGQSAH